MTNILLEEGLYEEALLLCEQLLKRFSRPDFPHGELVLRRKNAKSLEQFVAASGKSVAVPFWIASDHFMVGWGRVETLPPALLFVDTGLAVAGVKLAESVIKEPGSSWRKTKLPQERAAAES